MKSIKLKSLQLINFKGIKSLNIDTFEQDTFIYGDNGTGKTTVFDAFIWLLFGKDSTDRKDFEIKTLDAQNNVIPKIEHEVCAVIDVGGVEVELKRIFKEKWVKKQGAFEAEFTGNETLYEWNGVPLKASDYAAKINQMVDEGVFKDITNPAAFLTSKWQDQRQKLVALAGNITDADVASGHGDFEKLIDKLKVEGKSIEEYKKQVKASISKSNAEIKSIPTRIDEVERGKPGDIDFEGLKTQLADKQKEVEAVNEQIADRLKAQEADIEKQRQIQKDIYAIETEVTNKRHALKQEASKRFAELSEEPLNIQRQIDAKDSEIKSIDGNNDIRNVRLKGFKHNLEVVNGKIKELRAKWETENSKAFVMDDNECKCPTCKREFEPSEIEDKRKDLEQHFVSNKKANLKAITEQGQQFTNEKLSLEAKIEETQALIDESQPKLKVLWEQRADLSEALKACDTSKTEALIYKELETQSAGLFIEKQNNINTLRDALTNRESVDTSDLKQTRQSLNHEIERLRSEIIKEDQIGQANKRISQLEEEEKVLAQAIMDMEKEQYIIEAFEKAKSNAIEESVNNRFELVKFKLFKTLINGGEEPHCTALINGVPYSDANTASKINAGLDVINTLCDHYGVTAPVFIDNRESVVELIPCGSQIVHLVVSEADKKLKVVSLQKEAQLIS